MRIRLLCLASLVLLPLVGACSCGQPPAPPAGPGGLTVAPDQIQLEGRVPTDKFNDQATGSESPVTGGRLVIRFSAEPDNLSFIDNSAYSSYVAGYLYNSLLRRDPETFLWEGSLADTWTEEDVLLLHNGQKVFGTITLANGAYTVTRGNTVETVPAAHAAELRQRASFTFHLRPGVTFHDGTPLTARDVEFSYRILRNEWIDAPHLRVYYQDLNVCEVIDTATVRLEYAKQYWMARDFAGGFPILPAHLYNADRLLERNPQQFGRRFNQSEWHRKPVGSGPYVFKAWATGSQITLARNPNYWDAAHLPRLDEIVFKFIVDNVAALQSLKNGETDFLPEMSPEQYREEAGAPEFLQRFARCEYYTGNYGYIGWNLRRPPFDDRRVRLAMAYGAFDREKFLQEVLHGLGKIVTGPQYYYGPAYDHGILPHPYDPEKAKQLLLEAGWYDRDGDGIRDKDGKPFAFELLMPQMDPSAPARKRAEMMIENLKKLGIQMTVRELEWATFIDFINDRKFDACQLGWATDLESDPYQVWHTSAIANGGSNHVGFGNAETDRLLEESRRTLDDTARRRLFFQFHRIVHEEQPYLFLYCAPDLGAYAKKYRGVKFYVVRPGWDLSEWFIPAGSR